MKIIAPKENPSLSECIVLVYFETGQKGREIAVMRREDPFNMVSSEV